jgi:hypothetical protein
MARVQPPFPISGSIGDYTFATNGETTYMKMKNWLQGDRWHKDPAFKRARENAQTFGGAAKVGCRIYSALAGNRTNRKEGRSRKIYLPYSHNVITKRIHKHAERQGRTANAYTFAAAWHALQGLDLSNKESQTNHITLQPLGPNHNPTHVKVGGLKEAARTIQQTLNGNGRLEVRLQLIHIAFPEITYNKEDKEWTFTTPGSHLIKTSPKSAWIPADYLPIEPLRLSLEPVEPVASRHRAIDSAPPAQFEILTPLDTPKTTPTLIFLQIEWQEVRNTGTTKHLNAQAIVRMAAMQCDEHTQRAIATQKPKTQSPRPRKPVLTNMTPEQFLQKALKGLIDNPPQKRKPG